MLRLDSGAARRAWTYAVVVLALFVMFAIRKTLLIFAIAIMLAYLLHPLTEGIHRLSRLQSRVPAVGIVFLLLLVAAAVFIWFIEPGAQHEAAQLLQLIQTRRLADWIPLGLPVGVELESHAYEVLGLISQAGVERGMTHVVRTLVNLVVVPILSFLLLKDGPCVRKNALEFFGIGAGSERLLRDAHVLMLDYMRALLLLAITTLVIFAGAMTLFRVPYGMFLAFLSFALEFIPVVGPVTAAAAILSVSSLAGSPMGHLVALGGFLFGYRIFQDYVVAPLLMNRSVQLHPLLIIFGIFAGGDIGGIAGIFLSVPVLALGRLIFYEIRRYHARPGVAVEAVAA